MAEGRRNNNFKWKQKLDDIAESGRRGIFVAYKNRNSADPLLPTPISRIFAHRIYYYTYEFIYNSCDNKHPKDIRDHVITYMYIKIYYICSVFNTQGSRESTEIYQWMIIITHNVAYNRRKLQPLKYFASISVYCIIMQAICSI